MIKHFKIFLCLHRSCKQKFKIFDKLNQYKTFYSSKYAYFLTLMDDKEN